jgi:hypothetical protein
MSEKELGRALLELDAHKLASVPDTREQTWKILERDRRRVWRWTALTIGLWAAALLMVLLMLVAYALVFPLQAHLHQQQEAARRSGATGAAQAESNGEAAAGDRPSRQDPELIDVRHLTPDQLADAQLKAQIAFQMITVGVTASVGLTCFAILSSVCLGLASRRATLRQINASLLEISQQIKELRKPADSKPA